MCIIAKASYFAMGILIEHLVPLKQADVIVGAQNEQRDLQKNPDARKRRGCNDDQMDTTAKKRKENNVVLQEYAVFNPDEPHSSNWNIKNVRNNEPSKGIDTEQSTVRSHDDQTSHIFGPANHHGISAHALSSTGNDSAVVTSTGRKVNEVSFFGVYSSE